MVRATEKNRYMAQPPARAEHVAVASSNRMLVWGGNGGKKSRIMTSTVEIYDVLSGTWQETRQLRSSSLPENLNSMAVIWYEEKAYTFGGFIQNVHDDLGQMINDVYEVDLSSLECKKLEPYGAPSPTPRDSSAMVYCKRKLVNYGGRLDDDVESDELHVFDLNSSEFS